MCELLRVFRHMHVNTWPITDLFRQRDKTLGYISAKSIHAYIEDHVHLHNSSSTGLPIHIHAWTHIQDLMSPPKSVFDRGTLHTVRYMKRCLDARIIGVLDLSSFNLTTLPPEVTELTNLTYLKIDTNRYVPPCILDCPTDMGTLPLKLSNVTYLSALSTSL